MTRQSLVSAYRLLNKSFCLAPQRLALVLLSTFISILIWHMKTKQQIDYQSKYLERQRTALRTKRISSSRNERESNNRVLKAGNPQSIDRKDQRISWMRIEDLTFNEGGRREIPRACLTRRKSGWLSTRIFQNLQRVRRQELKRCGKRWGSRSL